MISAQCSECQNDGISNKHGVVISFFSTSTNWECIAFRLLRAWEYVDRREREKQKDQRDEEEKEKKNQEETQ